MSHRILSFLIIAMLMAGWSSMAAAAERDDSACEKLGWKLSMQAWTTHYTTLWESIDIAHDAGIHYIELYREQPLGGGIEGKLNHHLPHEILVKLQEKLASAGIKAVAYGVVPLSKNEDESRKVFEFAKAMGMITINSEPAPDAFDVIEKLVKEYDIRVGLHDHPKPSRYWDPEIVLKAIIGRDPRIGACADTGHWPRSGMLAIDCLKKLDGHLESSHLKDTNKIGNGAQDVVYGTGVNDLAGQLAEFKRQGFKGPISIEYDAGKKGPDLLADLRAMVSFVDKAANDLVKTP